MKIWKKLTQQEFDRIKTLKSASVKDSDIVRIVGKSPATTSRVAIAKDMQTYREVA